MTLHTLFDPDSSQHTLQITPTGTLVLDGEFASIDLSDTLHLRFVTSSTHVSCSAKAFWHVIAGEQATPTAEEAGRLLAQNLLYCEQLRQWRAYLHEMQAQATTMLQMTVPEPTFPSPRLDAFTEEVLARTRSTVTTAELETLAILLKKDTAVIRGWLAARGKQVLEPEPVVIQAQAATQEPIAVPSDKPAEQAMSPQPPSHGRWNIFWTPDRLQMLQAALKQHESVMPVKKRLLLVAEQCGFKLQAVQAKFYELRKKEENERLQRFVEDRKRAEEQADTEPNRLPAGPTQWAVDVDGTLQRWGLACSYGNFPDVLKQPGTVIIYRAHLHAPDRRYLVKAVWTNKLVVQSEAVAQAEADEDLVEMKSYGLEAIPA